MVVEVPRKMIVIKSHGIGKRSPSECLIDRLFEKTEVRHLRAHRQAFGLLRGCVDKRGAMFRLGPDFGDDRVDSGGIS